MKLDISLKWFLPAVILYTLIFALCFQSCAKADEAFKVTAYCPCKICCGKTDGVTASGKQAKYGYIACNWLKFGTKVNIAGLGVFTVQDRGAKSLFGSKSNHIKHFDVFFPTHKQAKQFGVKYLDVTILRGGK